MGSGGHLVGFPASCALEQDIGQRYVDSARSGASLLGNKTLAGRKAWQLNCASVLWTGIFIIDHLCRVPLLCRLCPVRGGHAGEASQSFSLENIFIC